MQNTWVLPERVKKICEAQPLNCVRKVVLLTKQERIVKPSIDELEKLLASDKPLDIQINPDGSLSAVDKGMSKNIVVKVLPLRQVLGDSY